MGATNTDFTVRLKGDGTSYTSTLFKAKAANDAFNHSVGGVSKGLTAINGPLNGIAGRVTALNGLVTAGAVGFAAFGAAIAASSLAVVSAIKEHDEFNIRNKKTEALLRATGYASGFTAEKLDEMSQAVALNTLASVEGIKDAQNVLLTFKSVSGDVYGSAIELAQDMAAVMGSDAKSAALQLGKALESPTDGISALKRAGVSFTDAQKDMIRAMEDSGRVVDAQKFILDTLKNQIGGAGAAEADGTVVGAIDTLSQRWQKLKINFAESSGAASGAQKFLNALANGIEAVNQDLWPDDDRRMQQLAAKRMELKAELESLSKGERTGFLSYIVGTESEWYNVQRQLNAVSQEMREIQNRKKAQIIEEQNAQTASQNVKNEHEYKVGLGVTPEQAAAGLESVRKAFADQLEVERMAMAARQEMIDAAYDAKQIDADGWQAITEQNFARHQQKITEIQERESKKRADNEARAQREALSAFQGVNGEFLSSLETAGKQRSALYKAAFVAQKAAAIPSMIVSTNEAATKSLTLDPTGVMSAYIKGVGYASVGVVAGTAIAGVAHGGMGYIPEESTYLLQKGEGVLSPKQNQEVQKMAVDFNAGKAAAGSLVVNLYEDASKAGSVERETGPNEEQIANVFVTNIRNAGSIAQSLEHTYGIQRKGR